LAEIRTRLDRPDVGDICSIWPQMNADAPVNTTQQIHTTLPSPQNLNSGPSY